MPLVQKWAEQQYGPDTRVALRFIYVHRSGDIQVHIDVDAPGRPCVFARFFKWQITAVDDHRASGSGC